MGRFTRESFIIQNKDVLRDDYQPESLEERDEELDEYAAALRPVIQGWQPSNVFLYGVTGVGKTAATHNLLKELRMSAEQYDDVNLEVIELNCTGFDILPALKGEDSPKGSSRLRVSSVVKFPFRSHLNGRRPIITKNVLFSAYSPVKGAFLGHVLTHLALGVVIVSDHFSPLIVDPVLELYHKALDAATLGCEAYTDL
ncbi:ORC1-type DNA replication protein [Halalkalicoccus paucihalophilus]|uniref:ORC1-type DNA replication protein n=1 Tax=Halalkalicoccus paucihalophilus TaxID=1008153 RepID=A0A151A8Z1_9EURY|nr:ATP-binding protein [Halalkalicoccus paucihalophilus]KYH24166.1 ORC1-type DNA replication protein [Halalkalicoccus paucihalophilus]